MLSKSCIGIIGCSTDGVVRAANDGARALLRCDDLVGSNLFSGVAWGLLTATGLEEVPCSRYRDVRLPDGQTRAFLVNVVGAGACLAVTFMPAEWALDAWNQVDALVLGLDEGGRLVFVHQGDPRLPWIPSRLLGHSLMDVSPEFAPRLGVSRELLERVMAGGHQREHFELSLPDGSAHAVNVNIMPWRFCGFSCGALALVSDVTRVPEAAIQDAEAATRRFWRVLQHELRNPLQTMQAAVEILQPKLDQGDRTLRLLKEQIQTLSEYLSDQLLMGRPTLGVMSLGRLSEIVRQEVERACLRLCTYGLQFSHRPPAAEPLVRLHPESMGRVFANLFRNIAQARSDAHVEVKYACGDGAVVCTVADDGPGLPPHTLSAEWLGRVQPSEHLGLSLAAATLRAHAGSLTLGNRRQGGAFVQIRIPTADAYDTRQSPAGGEAAAAAEGEGMYLLHRPPGTAAERGL